MESTYRISWSSRRPWEFYLMFKERSCSLFPSSSRRLDLSLSLFSAPSVLELSISSSASASASASASISTATSISTSASRYLDLFLSPFSRCWKLLRWPCTRRRRCGLCSGRMHFPIPRSMALRPRRQIAPWATRKASHRNMTW